MHNLIIKYFEGTITQDEKDLLFSEMRIYEDLKVEFASVQNIHALTSLLPVENDRSHGLENLLRFKQCHKFQSNRQSLKNLIGYAAAICIAVVTTWAVMNLSLEKVEPFTIAYQEFSVPAGQRALVKLHDGTSVWLSARSTLRYPNQFVNNERRVELDGEAYFEVSRDENKPFVVATEKLDIKVLGTNFNVFAYKGRNDFNTSLIEGSVKIYDKRDESKALELKPNERAELVDNILIRRSFTNKDFLLWKEGIYAFDDVPFNDILNKLELYYDVAISINNSRLSNYNFSGKFRQRDGVESVLSTLQKISNFSYIKDDELNTITIR